LASIPLINPGNQPDFESTVAVPERWRNLQGVAGSNPVSPTNDERTARIGGPFVVSAGDRWGPHRAGSDEPRSGLAAVPMGRSPTDGLF